MRENFERSLEDLEKASKADRRPKLGKLGAYRSTINMPINRIIIISLGIFLPLYVFRYELKPKVMEKLPEKYQAQLEKLVPAPRKHSHHDDKAPGTTSKKDAHSAQHAGDDSAAPEGGAAKANSEPEMVLIEGKYYPKSPDNIYMINGKRLFFKDNRKAQNK